MESTTYEDTIRIVVGVLTRGRPKMFADLLTSFENLTIAEDINLSFCFVENDTALSIEAQVADFANRTGYEARSLLQTKLGIPYARNSALDYALEAGADYLAFIDDDELATPDWLAHLFECHKKNDADLTGGPVHPVAQNESLSYFQQLNLEAIQFRETRTARKNVARVAAGAGHKVTVATNNWLVRLDFVRQHDLRFDESLGRSSGSDTVFWEDLLSKGGRVAWSSEAIVLETVPASRLTMGYLFNRACDGTRSTFVKKRDRGGMFVTIISRLTYIVSKSVIGSLRLIIMPFNKGRSLPLAVRSFGCAYGAVLSLVGGNSSHYDTTHGN